jgi:hypothetical protein
VSHPDVCAAGVCLAELMFSYMFELKRPASDHADYLATLPKGDNEECAEFEVRHQSLTLQ